VRAGGEMSVGLELARRRMEAMYRSDRRGRLTSINQWDGGAAPRIHLMRTTAGVICRFRSDLPDALVSRLEELCNREPAGEPLGELPAHYDRYLDLLSSHAPVERVWAGPAYLFERDLPLDADAVSIDERNAELLRGGLDAWLPDVPHRRPFIAIVQDGRAVSICASVRISDSVHEAGVETRPEYRRRGYGANAVVGWARAVRSIGAAPFYSTSFENLASRRVAGRLGLSPAGVDFSVT
jgi:RimJ/RimL family protein N-acetyltransferase